MDTLGFCADGHSRRRSMITRQSKRHRHRHTDGHTHTYTQIAGNAQTDIFSVSFRPGRGSAYHAGIPTSTDMNLCFPGPSSRPVLGLLLPINTFTSVWIRSVGSKPYLAWRSYSAGQNYSLMLAIRFTRPVLPPMLGFVQRSWDAWSQ